VSSLSVIPTPDSLTFVDYGHDRCHFRINCRLVSVVFAFPKLLECVKFGSHLFGS
jgi:hypothetical protein